MNIRLTEDGSAIAFGQSGTGRTAPFSIQGRWLGYLMSAVAVLSLFSDGVIKVLQWAPAVAATVQLGYPAHLVVGIGFMELACLAMYVVPRNSVLGAIILTGYLGGAIATHMRNGSDLFSLVFPTIIGGLVWGGLFVRDHRLRALVPLRQ